MKYQKQNKRKKEDKLSFLKFLIQKPQQLDWIIVFSCCLLAYIGIRLCCPYPFAMSDSAGYVDAAAKDMFFVYRPFGYSLFLQVIHSVTANIHFIFIIQMLLLFLATAFLALTVKYFYTPAKKGLWYVALLFLIFTPSSFIMANWIMSDLLFSVLVYLIVALFIFIIKRESWLAAVLYALVLFAALHVRYSAMVFPFVLMPFFLMKKGKIRWLILFFSVITFSVFYSQTKESMKKTLRMDQFSTGFDGWVYANNAFYALPYIDLKPEDLKKNELKRFHHFVMKDIDKIEEIVNKGQLISSNFMWDNNLPLKQYLFKTMQEKRTPYLPTFVRLGSGVYKDYAIYIMTHYPFSFLRYYYFPNMQQMFYPDMGIIGTAGEEKSEVIYEYYNIDKKNLMQVKSDALFNPYFPVVVKISHLILWIFILCLGIWVIIQRKKLIFSSEDKIVLWGLFGFAAIYYASSIFAAPMELRYTMPVHPIQFVFCYLLMNKVLDKKNQNCT